MDSLENMRSEIDRIDRSIIALLATRDQVVREVWRYKTLHKLPPLQPKRWAKVCERNRILSLEHNLDPDYIQKIWDTIHENALQIERSTVSL
jgi:chorismate mutase-like protein